jgi:hypothetical protein
VLGVFSLPADKARPRSMLKKKTKPHFSVQGLLSDAGIGLRTVHTRVESGMSTGFVSVGLLWAALGCLLEAKARHEWWKLTDMDVQARSRPLRQRPGDRPS